MTVLLIGLAAARLTRLLVDDVILDRPREWVTTRADGKWLTLVSCAWCVSFYCVAAIGVGVWATIGLAAPPVALGAAWWISTCAYWLTQLLAGAAESL